MLDLIGIAMAPKQGLKKLGVGTKTKVLSSKGLTGTDILGDGTTFAKVCSEPIDMNDFTKVVYTNAYGDSVDYPKEDFFVGTEGPIQMLLNSDSEALFAFSVSMDFAEEGFAIEKGTYIGVSDGFFISITFETIDPVDQKFIPPMDSLTLNGADGKQYAVTVNESGVLTATAIE